MGEGGGYKYIVGVGGQRAVEDARTGEADGGHIRIVQGAYISLTSLLPGEEDNSTAGGGAGTNSDEGNPAAELRGHQIIASYRRLFRDAVGRAINRGGEAEFTRRAIYPAVASMAQALVAQRFGNAELSRRELEAVESQVAEIASSAAGWQKKDAAAIAARITEQVYGALAGGIA